MLRNPAFLARATTPTRRVRGWLDRGCLAPAITPLRPVKAWVDPVQEVDARLAIAPVVPVVVVRPAKAPLVRAPPSNSDPAVLPALVPEAPPGLVDPVVVAAVAVAVAVGPVEGQQALLVAEDPRASRESPRGPSAKNSKCAKRPPWAA